MENRKAHENGDRSHGKPGRVYIGLIVVMLCVIGVLCGIILLRDTKSAPNDIIPDSSATNSTQDDNSPVDNIPSDMEQDVPDAEPSFKISFLDVGQGDCTVISCDNEYMIVDGGPEWAGTRVQKFLMKEGINSLKYAVGTHFDADHIGGLDVIIYKFECENVIAPDYQKETNAYDNLMEVLENKNLKIHTPKVGECFMLGSAEVTVIAPYDGQYEDDNDYSIGLKITFENKSFILIGDASGDSEKKMAEGDISLKADLLKVAHHGSSSSTTEPFLGAVQPEYAIISCGKDNDYGHPHKEVMNRLNERGIKSYRTDMSGTITVTVNGGEITINTER